MTIINNTFSGLFTSDQGQAPYSSYQLETSYQMDNGYRQLSVGTAAPGPCELVKLHAAIGRKIITFSITRKSKRPVVPAIDPDTTDQVLESAIITPSAPQPTADGSNVEYGVTGVYTYLLLTPLITGDELPMGNIPALTGQFDTYVLDDNDTSDLIAP
jgi:hypothetical protein